MHRTTIILTEDSIKSEQMRKFIVTIFVSVIYNSSQTHETEQAKAE